MLSAKSTYAFRFRFPLLLSDSAFCFPLSAFRFPLSAFRFLLSGS
jgi:hypothetical protein